MCCYFPSINSSTSRYTEVTHRVGIKVMSEGEWPDIELFLLYGLSLERYGRNTKTSRETFISFMRKG